MSTRAERIERAARNIIKNWDAGHAPNAPMINMLADALAEEAPKGEADEVEVSDLDPRTPWHAHNENDEGTIDIDDADGNRVASLSLEAARDASPPYPDESIWGKASLIVRAVNRSVAVGELVEFVTAIPKMAATPDDPHDRLAVICAGARAALAKVKGE